MKKEYLDEIYNVIPKDQIFVNEPMKKQTSLKIGGPADVLIKADKIKEIQEIIKISNTYNIPLYVIGNGSNLLVKDEGVRGIVLKVDIKYIEFNNKKDFVEVKVGSGMLLSMLAYTLLKKEISGMEFASGIPGTIGGAVRMNAGAHGKEMKDIIVKTTYIDDKGNVKTITNKEHKFEYRKSIFAKNKYIIIETVLKLEYGCLEEIKKIMNTYSTWRKENQPLEYPNAGSTFKRGDDFVTAKLIDECGLKGYQIGGAQVSLKHAGFIVNVGNATAKDVIDLINHVKDTVYKKFNKKIELELETI